MKFKKPGTVDQFDLEQEIMNCWQVVDDIKTLYYAPDFRELSEDEMQNALLGLQTLYQMKFERLFDVYEKFIALKVE